MRTGDYIGDKEIFITDLTRLINPTTTKIGLILTKRTNTMKILIVTNAQTHGRTFQIIKTIQLIQNILTKILDNMTVTNIHTQ